MHSNGWIHLVLRLKRPTTCFPPSVSLSREFRINGEETKSFPLISSFFLFVPFSHFSFWSIWNAHNLHVSTDVLLLHIWNSEPPPSSSLLFFYPTVFDLTSPSLPSSDSHFLRAVIHFPFFFSSVEERRILFSSLTDLLLLPFITGGSLPPVFSLSFPYCTLLSSLNHSLIRIDRRRLPSFSPNGLPFNGEWSIMNVQ